MNVSVQAHDLGALVSSELRQYVIDTITCAAVPLNIFGCVTNIINIIVFLRMNQEQSINVSLLAIAVSDFFSCLGALVTAIFLSPLMIQSKGLPFLPSDIQGLSSTWVKVVFARITVMLTFVICAERCMCILLPMKVKTIITPRRIKIIIISIFVFGVSYKCVDFYGSRFTWKFSPFHNKTVLGVQNIENWEDIAVPFQTVRNILSQYILFTGIVILTIVLVVKLQQQTKWRQASGQSAAAEKSSKRDTKVAKTVCVIAAIFLACNFPFAVQCSALIAVPAYDYGERFHNMYMVIGGLTLFLESVNASVNILVYLKYIGQYREKFKQMFSYSCVPKNGNKILATI